VQIEIEFPNLDPHDGCGIRDICDLNMERHRILLEHTKLECSTMVHVACCDRKYSTATRKGCLLLLRILCRAVEEMKAEFAPHSSVMCYCVSTRSPCELISDRVCARASMLWRFQNFLHRERVHQQGQQSQSYAGEDPHSGDRGADYGVGYRVHWPPSAPSASSSPSTLCAGAINLQRPEQWCCSALIASHE
jgi:hypothetical protein